MKLGFTGTREGMRGLQMRAANYFLLAKHPSEVHHGDCVGADAQIQVLANGADAKTVAHPPTSKRLRAFCHEANEMREPKDCLARNKDIVDETDHLLAAPKTHIEEPRSGTWWTVRYALKTGKPVTIVWPDGTKSDYQLTRAGSGDNSDAAESSVLHSSPPDFPCEEISDDLGE
jgi:hypothetical protein